MSLDSISQWLNGNQWLLYLLLIYIAVTFVQILNFVILKLFKLIFKKKIKNTPHQPESNTISSEVEEKPGDQPVLSKGGNLPSPLPQVSFEKDKEEYLDLR